MKACYRRWVHVDVYEKEIYNKLVQKFVWKGYMVICECVLMGKQQQVMGLLV